MQNVDFGKPGFRQAFSNLMNKEGITSLYRGYLACLAGLFLQQAILAESVGLSNSPGFEKYAFPTYLFGFLLSHPFFLISTRV